MMDKENTESSNVDKIFANSIWELLELVRGDIPVSDYYFILLIFSVEEDGFNSPLDSSLLDIPNKDFHGELLLRLKQSEVRSTVDVFKGAINAIPPYKLKIILKRVFEIPFNISIFELVLERITSAQSKLSGNYLQPREVTKFVTSIVLGKWYSKHGFSNTYNPFAGLSSYGKYLGNNLNYYSQELNSKYWAIGELGMWLTNDNTVGFYVDRDDSVENWLMNPGFDDEKFDLIISTPPFNLKVNSHNKSNKKESIEKFLIGNSLNSLEEDGILICVIPTGFLYRDIDKGLRKYLIDDGLLDAIILLPSGLFKNTGIPVCVLVINKSKPHYGFVKMVDGSNFYSLKNSKEKILDDKKLTELIESSDVCDILQFVSFEEIQRNDYNLSVPRYFIKEYPGVELASIVETLRGDKIQQGEKGRFVRIKDLKDDKLDHLLDIENVEVKELPRNVRKIEESSLLLSLRWKTLKPTYFKYSGTPIYISNDIIALTIDQSKTDPRYLINVLQGENTSKQADAFRQGGVIPVIRKEDLLSIKVELPPIEEQSQIIAQVQKEVVIEEQKKLKSLIDEYAVDVSDENSFLRHQIAGSLKSVRKSFEAIKNIVQSQIQNNLEGVLDLKTNPNSKLSFGKYLEIIDRDLTSVHNSIRRTGKELEIVEFNPVEIDIVKFISEYCNELNENKTYQIKFDSGVEDFEEAQLTKATILGDSEMLRKMLDNIVENAEKHGFKNSTSIKNIIDVQMMFDFNDMVVQVDFSNTGEPLEDISHEDMIRKGGRAGLNGGDGYGMWFVNKIMKKHSGKFTFTDETGPEGLHGELVTTMELEFPIRAE